ncbi:MAG: glycoside hydrolase family protein [Opitutus sp.]
MNLLPRTAILLLTLFVPLSAPADPLDIAGRLAPVPRESGFKMEGYFVWCGSVIKVDDTYHLFSSRWPLETKFPDGYRTHSEIVRATAPRPEGPYTFQEVVIGGRAAGKWDSEMAHNPAIYRTGDTFVLYYNGSDVGTRHRDIGIATAKAITGPWTRRDRPLDLGIATDANNPAAWFEPDGSVKLIWRTVDLKVCISTASSFEGPYTLANGSAWPAAKLEDFFAFRHEGEYHFICEDNVAGISGHERWGVHLVSPNGIDSWKTAPVPVVYDHVIRWTDGGTFQPRRRERPWFLIENGAMTHLFTGVYDGERSWNQPVPLVSPLPLNAQTPGR